MSKEVKTEAEYVLKKEGSLYKVVSVSNEKEIYPPKSSYDEIAVNVFESVKKDIKSRCKVIRKEERITGDLFELEDKKTKAIYQMRDFPIHRTAGVGTDGEEHIARKNKAFIRRAIGLQPLENYGGPFYSVYFDIVLYDHKGKRKVEFDFKTWEEVSKKNKKTTEKVLTNLIKTILEVE